MGNVKDPVKEEKRVSYESGWQLTYYQEDKVVIPKPCAVAPRDTVLNSQGHCEMFAFSKETAASIGICSKHFYYVI